MRTILGNSIVFLFSVIIFGGMLWGLTGVGELVQKNWNIVNLLLGSYPKIEGLLYLFIGLCTLAKLIYNVLWEPPRDPPHIIFILFTVVLSGLYWGVIGTGLIFNINLRLLEQIPGMSDNITGLIYYTVGIFTLLKLGNFIYNAKHGKRDTAAGLIP